MTQLMWLTDLFYIVLELEPIHHLNKLNTETILLFTQLHYQEAAKRKGIK